MLCACMGLRRDRASLDAHEALVTLHGLLDSGACIIIEEFSVAP